LEKQNGDNFNNGERKMSTNEGLIGKKIVDIKGFWIKLDDGTQAHIDFMVYK
jgi:hypothetical protein